MQNYICLNLSLSSETGWDELMARKYCAWIHHTALDALALWFVAQTKLNWQAAYPRDPALIEQLELLVLQKSDVESPCLSRKG